MLTRSLLVWFTLLVLAIVNGAFREVVLMPRMSRSRARAISTLMLSAVIVGVGWIATAWIAPRTPADAWGIGVTWVTLTLAFEFFAGHFLFGKTWETLLGNDSVLAGRIWGWCSL